MSTAKQKFKKLLENESIHYIGTCVKLSKATKYLVDYMPTAEEHNLQPKNHVYLACCICGHRFSKIWFEINNKYYFVCSPICAQELTIDPSSRLHIPIKSRVYYDLLVILKVCAYFGSISLIGFIYYLWKYMSQ